MIRGNTDWARMLADGGGALSIVLALAGVYCWDRGSIDSLPAHERRGLFLTDAGRSTSSAALSEETVAGGDMGEPATNGVAILSTPPVRGIILGGDPPRPPAKLVVDSPKKAKLVNVDRSEVAIPEQKSEPTHLVAPIVAEPAAARKVGEIEFFKTRSEANRHVFVVDCSGSMTGTRFEKAQAELARSLGQLTEQQRFSVIFFSGQFSFLPGEGRASLVKASPKNKRAAWAWMKQIQANGGTNPEPAIRFAIGMKPEVIWLLSDGIFQPFAQQTFQSLAAQSIVVNTTGFEIEGNGGSLRSIADRTHGVFRALTSRDAASSLYLAPGEFVLKTLHSADSAARVDALTVVFERELNLLSHLTDRGDNKRPRAGTMEAAYYTDLPDLLRDPSEQVRTEVHARFMQLAGGSDFGPQPGDRAEEIEAAISRWRKWCAYYFESSVSEVTQVLAHGDQEESWVAASVLRQAGAETPDEMIALLREALPATRAEIRQALRDQSSLDFGPSPDANETEVALAADRWAEWRKNVIRQKAINRAEAREKDAKRKLNIARQLLNSGKVDPALERLQAIIQDFSETAAAKEAAELMKSSR